MEQTDIWDHVIHVFHPPDDDFDAFIKQQIRAVGRISMKSRRGIFKAHA